MTSVIEGMNKFTSILAPTFYMLLYISIIATVIGIVIIIIRKFLGLKIPPKWISVFWLLFILSLIVPIKIESRLSIYNYILTDDVILNRDFEKSHNGLYKDKYNEAKQEYELYIDLGETDENKVLELNKNMNTAYIKSLIADTIIPCLWVMYMTTLLIMYIISYIVFSKKIRCIKEPDRRLTNILNDCKQELGITRNINIIIQEHIMTPSIFGIFNMRILLNESINELADKEIKYILLHELSHYKRKDNVLNMLIAGIKIIYCFNPIIWMLCAQLRKDMELATDAVVIEKIGIDEQKEYCNTLVNLFSIKNKPFMVKVLPLNNDLNNLKRRIAIIKVSKEFSKNKFIVTILSLSIILGLIVFFDTANMSENNVESSCVISELKACEILEVLPYAEYNEKVEIQISKMPYELNIKYNMDIDREKLKYNTFVLFSKIQNIDVINYTFNNDEIITMKKEDIYKL